MNYAEKLQTEFNFASGDSVNCPTNKLYFYKSNAGSELLREGSFADETFTIEEASKGRDAIFFKIGSEGK